MKQLRKIRNNIQLHSHKKHQKQHTRSKCKNITTQEYWQPRIKLMTRLSAAD